MTVFFYLFGKMVWSSQEINNRLPKDALVEMYLGATERIRLAIS